MSLVLLSSPYYLRCLGVHSKPFLKKKKKIKKKNTFVHMCMRAFVDTAMNGKVSSRCSRTSNLVQFSQSLLVGVDDSSISCHHLFS